MLRLKDATLGYGRTAVPVKPSELLPIPEFDFDNIERTTFIAMSVMSQAAGGHLMSEATLSFPQDRSSAILVGNGFSIMWGEATKYTPEELADPVKVQSKVNELNRTRVQIRVPFRLTTDRFGDGWKRAASVPQSWVGRPNHEQNVPEGLDWTKAVYEAIPA